MSEVTSTALFVTGYEDPFSLSLIIFRENGGEGEGSSEFM